PYDAPGNAEYGTDFGSFDVDAGSRAFTVLINNTDVDTPLTIDTITVSGSDADDFSIVQPPASVDPRSFVALSIIFDPQAAGEREALITIPSNDPDAGDSPFVFSVKGLGVNGTPALAPDLGITKSGK